MSLTHIPSSTEDANTFMEEGILVDEAVPQRLDAPKWIRTFGFKIPLAIFAITLLCFGGVHGKVLYSGQIALFLSAAVVLLVFSLNSSVSQSDSFGGISKTVVLMLVWATLAPGLIEKRRHAVQDRTDRPRQQHEPDDHTKHVSMRRQ